MSVVYWSSVFSCTNFCRGILVINCHLLHCFREISKGHQSNHSRIKNPNSHSKSQILDQTSFSLRNSQEHSQSSRTSIFPETVSINFIDTYTTFSSHPISFLHNTDLLSLTNPNPNNNPNFRFLHKQTDSKPCSYTATTTSPHPYIIENRRNVKKKLKPS